MTTPRIQPRPDREQGAALIMAVIFVLMLVSFTFLVLRSYRAQSSNAIFRASTSVAFDAADMGVAKGKLILTADPTPYTDGQLYTLAANVDNATITVQEINNQTNPFTFRLLSTGTNGQETRTIELILQLEQDKQPLAAPGMGAVIANGSLALLGNIQIDGNDHDPSGNLGGMGNDAPGIVTTGLVSQGGSSDVGGGGQALGGSPTEGVGIDTNATVWEKEGSGVGGTGNSADDTDGVDNDGDGVADENGFPNRPAAVFGMANEDSLKAQASADGTYFTNTTDYDNWMSSTTAAQRGGKIIYLEVPNGSNLGQFNLPHNPPPAKASILIVAGADPTQHNTTIGPVHIQNDFQGFVIADTYNKVNGNGSVVGSLLSFNPSNATKLGNGNAKISFSSEVMSNLPGVATGGSPWIPEVQSWRETVQ